MGKKYSSQEINKLIIEDKLEETLEMLIETFSEKSLYEHKNSALILMIRLKEFRKKVINGTITPFDIEINSIRESVIKLTNYYSDLELIINSEDSSVNYGAELLITSRKELPLKHIDKFNKNENLWEISRIYKDKPSNNISENNARFEGSRWILRNFTDDSRITCLKEYEFNDFHDYLVEIKMKQITDASPYLELNWGAYDSTNYLFRFSIRPRRYMYEIIHLYNGRKKIIKERTTEKCINIFEPNILSILKKQERVFFFINQKLVHTTDSISLHGNLIGPSLYDKGTGEFEYILVYN